MAATSEEKFNAAVKVIRGLPKNGSFQPSHELMLKFYAYYKQATEGPCSSSKPGIWNLVSRKKWEAWAELGQMQKESAMLLYVDELKNVSKHVKKTLYPPEIVEMMPQTDSVAEFTDTLGAFYELVDDEKNTPQNNALESKALENGPKQLNGTAFNGEGDESLDHSGLVGEMLKINNNDAKKGGGGGDNGDSPHRDRRDFAKLNGDALNGHRDAADEDEDREDSPGTEDEGEEGEEEGGEREGEGGEVEEGGRLDSGSDTDEFCDTSDQMLQAPSRASSLLTTVTSTPVGGGRRGGPRVRFAPHVYTADDAASLSSFVDRHDLSAALHDMSNLSSQMMTERLGLGSPTGVSFLPQTTEFPPRTLTESLHVNNSFSSLASLAGDDSVAGDSVEEDEEDVVDEGLTFNDRTDLVSSRGGGQEEGSNPQAGGSYSGQRGARGAVSNRGRDPPHNTSGGSRRGLFPSGSGGGGQRGGGQGRPPSSSLDQQILITLIRLQQDMTDISQRLGSLELVVKMQREEQAKKVLQSKWWPFPGMSKKLVFLLVVWPFLAPFIISVLSRRRRR